MKEIITGGFPVISLPKDHEGIGGWLCDRLLFGDEESVQEFISSDDKRSRLVRMYKTLLPSMFALMHFHMDFLRKGKCVAVVEGSSFEKQVESTILGWLDAFPNKLIFYCYRDSFGDLGIRNSYTGYMII